MNGRQLRKLFEEFNRDYFNGRLRPYAIRVVDHITWLDESGSCSRGAKLIRIRRGLCDEEAASTLIHEMAHAAATGNHGLPWKREMIRLREAGAPLVEPDSTVLLEAWSGSRVSKRQFRASVSDALAYSLDLTLPQVIRHFISTEGGPSTVSEFLKRYPWAREVFRQATREATAEQSRVAGRPHR
jgi:hypothetical protein